MKAKLLILFLSVLIIGSSSCKSSDDDNDGISCTEIFVYGLNVTLKNATTDAIITENVTIKATHGDYEETLVRIESSNSFTGAGERSGNYILTISSPNYQNFISEPFQVSADECHVITRDIEITLQPN